MSASPKPVSSPPWVLDLDQTPSRPIDAQCIGVAEHLMPDRLLHLATTQSLFNVVQKKGFAFDQEMRASEALVAAPDSFRRFPVSSILSPGAEGEANERAPMLADIEFSSSTHKKDVLSRVQQTMIDQSASQTMIEDVMSVTDELFTNAIYNAPFVDFGTGLNPGVSRLDQTEIRYGGGKRARILLAADEKRFIVGCEDPFGTLNLLRYLHRIKETYVRGPAATMNFGPGGAGLGSYIIFNAGSSLYFGVWPGSATVLCCVMPLGLSYRRRIELPKHLHWVQR